MAKDGRGGIGLKPEQAVDLRNVAILTETTFNLAWHDLTGARLNQ
jgi:hypothetical protein